MAISEARILVAVAATSFSLAASVKLLLGVPWIPIAETGVISFGLTLIFGVGLTFIYTCINLAFVARKLRLPVPPTASKNLATPPSNSMASLSAAKSADSREAISHGSGEADNRTVAGMAYLSTVPATGRLAPSPEDTHRMHLLEERLNTSAECTPAIQQALVAWVSYSGRNRSIDARSAADAGDYRGKGLRALLLQVVRRVPAKAGPDDIEAAWKLLMKAAQWRASHRIHEVFKRGYPRSARLELKRRLLPSFYYGHAKDCGSPIYYNSMISAADLEHADLIPGIFQGNDLSIIWIQEAEYREAQLFPERSRESGILVNHMYSVIDADSVGMGRLKLMKYFKLTAGLNSEYYPDSVKQILVVNCPSLISWLYSFVKPFIPETTQKKIVFCDDNGYSHLLQWTGDAAMIPKEYGGKGPSSAELVNAFDEKLRAFCEKTSGYEEAPDNQARDSTLRAALAGLAEER